MVQRGYAVPHWPRPYGLAAGAIEQLVIEEEFRAAGIDTPNYQITGWVILTLIQHGTPDQVVSETGQHDALAGWGLGALRDRQELGLGQGRVGVRRTRPFEQRDERRSHRVLESA